METWKIQKIYELRHQSSNERRRADESQCALEKSERMKNTQEATVIYASMTGRSSQKGRRTDALAPGADERRDKLRKAPGSCK